MIDPREQFLFSDALFYRERFMNPIPIECGTKHPPKGFPLRDYFQRHSLLSEIRRWFGRESDYQVAITMGTITQLVGIDVDDDGKARELEKLLPHTEMQTKTPRGRHFIFQIQKNQIVTSRVKATVLGVEADVRGEHSLLLAPPSLHPCGKKYERAGRFEWVGVPYFDCSWVENAAVEDTGSKSHRIAAGEPIRDLMAYCAKISSIEGQNGSKGCYRIACLCRDQKYTKKQTFEFMREWQKSELVQPKWSAKELMHKIEGAYRQ